MGGKLFFCMVASTSLSLAQDSDGDGVPDVWESSKGSDPDVANADSDFDRDRVSLFDEYAIGGSPTGEWLVTKIPFPAGVSGLDDAFLAIPDFNNQGSFLIRANAAMPTGGSTIKSWLWKKEGGYPFASTFRVTD